MTAHDSDAFEWRCTRCASLEADRESWWLDGYQSGRASVQASPLDDAHLRELLQLCHPDKHRGSALAVRVTSWLNSLREVAK